MFREAEPFITLKVHKDNFTARPSCRLINPAKSNVGRISKVILERVNKAVKAATGANQWINSNDVIKWFEALPNKQSLKFIKFDIDQFYPYITKKIFG